MGYLKHSCCTNCLNLSASTGKEKYLLMGSQRSLGLGRRLFKPFLSNCKKSLNFIVNSNSVKKWQTFEKITRSKNYSSLVRTDTTKIFREKLNHILKAHNCAVDMSYVARMADGPL